MRMTTWIADGGLAIADRRRFQGGRWHLDRGIVVAPERLERLPHLRVDAQHMNQRKERPSGHQLTQREPLQKRRRQSQQLCQCSSVPCLDRGEPGFCPLDGDPVFGRVVLSPYLLVSVVIRNCLRFSWDLVGASLGSSGGGRGAPGRGCRRRLWVGWSLVSGLQFRPTPIPCLRRGF